MNTLPLKRILTDNKWRKLEVTIVGHSQDYLTIVRIKDAKSFELAIINLSKADRKFAKTLPVSEKIISIESDNFVANRESAIKKLKEEISRLGREMNKVSASSQISMISGKIERLNREIQDLNDQIAEHQK